MRSCLQIEVPLRDKSITNIRHVFVQPSRAYGYAFAIGLCALVTGFLLLASSNVRFHNYAVIYILVAITAGYLFGHGPAIAACGLGMYAYLHFFVPQLQSPGPGHGFQVWADVVTFLLAIAIATICALTARRFTLETTEVLEDLSRSHARVTEIVESIGDPFFVLDEKWQYAFVNQAAERHFERSRRELLKRCICSLYPDEVGTFFHKACLEAIDKQTPIQFETAISRLNKWFEVRVSPISSGVAVHIHDITKRKHTEEEIQKQRNSANEYLNIANVIMLVLDLEGRVQMINRKGSEILGYAKEDITGKEWFANFLPIESRDEVRRVFEGLIAGKNEEFEYLESSILTKSGQKRLIAWRNAVLLDDHGKIYAVVSSGEDITERRKMEEMLRVTERHKLEFYRKMVLAATGYKLELVDNSEIEEMVGTPLATWQIADSQSIGVIRHCVQEAAEVAGMDPGKIEQFITCIGEAATNAW
ncbi:MAG: PAS domain S-box protein, partial [Armatimonadota bacterium]